jgi:hypothetical protein
MTEKKSTAKHDPEEQADKAASANLQASREEQGAPASEGATEGLETSEASGDPDEVFEPQEGAEGRREAPKAKGPRSRKRPASAPHVIGKADTDTVLLSALVFENKNARKSLSVHHLQRRLEELGYTEAGADRDGYYGPLTRAAVRRLQEDEELENTSGLVDLETLRNIFENDDNVTVSSR